MVHTFVGAEFDRIEFVRADGDYSKPAAETTYNGVLLDPFYEAKCIPFLRDGDLLWVTAHRRGSQPLKIITLQKKQSDRTINLPKRSFF